MCHEYGIEYQIVQVAKVKGIGSGMFPALETLYEVVLEQYDRISCKILSKGFFSLFMTQKDV